MKDKIIILWGVLLIYFSTTIDFIPEFSLLLTLIITIFFCIKKNRIVIGKSIIYIFLYLLLHTILNICLNNTDFTLFVKQLIGIGISYMFYKNILYQKSTIKIFVLYLKITFFIILIGLFQELVYLMGFESLADLSWLVPNQLLGVTTKGFLRVTSVFVEPAHFATAVTPAIFFSMWCIYNKKYIIFNKVQCILNIFVYLVTFSSLAYIGIVLMMLLLLLNTKINLKKILLIFISLATILVLYLNIEEFKVRIDDTISVLFDDKSITSKNLSTFALMSNADIAMHSLINTYGIGSGIGSHQINYYKYKQADFMIENIKMEMNVEDANSLGLRMISEMGFIGISLILVLIQKYYVSKKDENRHLISNCILVYIILRLIRQGHYFNDGFLFFIILYMNNHSEFRSDYTSQS